MNAKSPTGLAEHDKAGLRKATLKYLDGFDKELWFRDPIQTIIHGKPIPGLRYDTYLI